MRVLSTAAPGFETAFAALLDEARATTSDVGPLVAEIIAGVRASGDDALVEYTRQFDRAVVTKEALRVSSAEIDAAVAAVPGPLMAALETAARRIETFHRAQLPADLVLPDGDDLTMGMRWTPLEAAGLYVPGGKAAYPSSVLMNAIPARVAGVKRLAMCVPMPDGVCNNLVLAAARLAGVTEIFRIGGAQAVAALAFGTATVAPVDRIVGPGNAYVAEAKRQVFGHVGIDSVAGPSEVVIFADATCNPAVVAADLLAQAEHDEAAQAILMTTDAGFGARVAEEVARALETMPRRAIAGASWDRHGAIVVVGSVDEAVGLIDRLAPEHLQLMGAGADTMFGAIRHAGAVFLGRDCPEALGDYVAGPNHVLPTGRTARFASGLSVFDFLKRTTWIKAGREALRAIGPAAVALAEAEGLYAHARSITLRLHLNEG